MLLSTAIQMTPVIGDAYSCLTGLIGFDPIAGISLSAEERGLAIASAVVIGGGFHLLSRMGTDVASGTKLGRAADVGSIGRAGSRETRLGMRVEGGAGRSAVRSADDVGAQRVLFGQRRVSPAFSSNREVPTALRGRTLHDVELDLRSGRLSPDDVPIEAFVHGDQLVSANTRSLTALSMAGLRPTRVTLITPTDDMLRRLTEPPVVPGGSLPGTSVAITDSRTDLTILDTVYLP